MTAGLALIVFLLALFTAARIVRAVRRGRARDRAIREEMAAYDAHARAWREVGDLDLGGVAIPRCGPCLYRAHRRGARAAGWVLESARASYAPCLTCGADTRLRWRRS